MRKWTPAIPILVALGASAATFDMLPSRVAPDFHTVFSVWPRGTSESISRVAAATMLPALAVLVWALLSWLANVRAPLSPLPSWLLSEQTDARAMARFAPTHHTVIFSVVGAVCILHVSILGLALGWPLFFFNLAAVAIGVLTMVSGNVIPRSRPNWLVGIRTKATLTSAETWIRTHRLLGKLLMVTGGFVIACGLMSVPAAAIAWFTGVLVSIICSHYFGTRKNLSPSSTVRAVVLGGVIISTFISQTGSAQQQIVLTDTIAPRGVIESVVQIPTADIALPATLALPERFNGRIPVVLIVAGSGPTDRNANGPLIQTNTYAQIAWQLSLSGIASLRYDKRGLGPGGGSLNHSAMTTMDFVNDVTHAVAQLRNDQRFDRVVALGHSEGAMLVLQAANRGADVDGVIMLSGAGRKLTDVLREQIGSQTDSATLAQFDVAWDRFLKGDDPGVVPPVAQSVFVPVYRKFLQSMAAYDPPGELSRLSKPVMIVQGGMDWQTTPEDGKALYAAKPNARWLYIPEASHVYKAATSNKPIDQMRSYKDKSIALVPALVPEIVSFVNGVKR